MSKTSQIAAMTISNLRSLPQRVGASLVIVIGIAGVVSVLVSIFAMAIGFSRVMTGTGRANRVIVLDANGFGSTEAYSYLPREAVLSILDAPGIARDGAGSPIVSAEAYRAVRFDAPNGKRTSAVLRGVGAAHAQLRPEFHLVDGRMFQPGLHELIAGVGLRGRMGLAIGSRIHLRDGDWTIVGIFETGDSHDSELVGDADTVLSVLRASTFQSVTARIASPQDAVAFKDALSANPSLKVKALNEVDYYREHANSFGAGSAMYAVGWGVGSIMALGALFGALNTMYAAVAARMREIATLRAIGFPASVVVASLLIEALLLALTGGVIGAVIASSLFDGRIISTVAIAGGQDSQLTFAATVTSSLLALAILCAAGIGLLGALFPAIRAARLPIATALQVR
jgi:putative ABC transport system permease protein